MGNTSGEIEVHKRSTQLYGQTVHVLDRPAYSYRETSEFRSPSYEALECDSRQAFPAQSSDSNRVVPIAVGVQSLVLHMGPTPSGFVCDPVQSQTTEFCFPGAGSSSLGSRYLKSAVGSVGGLCLSPSLFDPPGDLKVAGSGLSQHDPHCPRMAKHALVLGPSGSVGSDSLQASSDSRPSDSALQRVTTQESHQPQSSCLAPRIVAIQEHGFSNEVAAQIEAPQRSSTRAVFKSKWSIFLKWCHTHEVDFRVPSVNQIADFLKYLFK